MTFKLSTSFKLTWNDTTQGVGGVMFISHARLTNKEGERKIVALTPGMWENMPRHIL